MSQRTSKFEVFEERGGRRHRGLGLRDLVLIDMGKRALSRLGSGLFFLNWGSYHMSARLCRWERGKIGIAQLPRGKWSSFCFGQRLCERHSQFCYVFGKCLDL